MARERFLPLTIRRVILPAGVLALAACATPDSKTGEKVRKLLQDPACSAVVVPNTPDRELLDGADIAFCLRLDNIPPRMPDYSPQKGILKEYET